MQNTQEPPVSTGADFNEIMDRWLTFISQAIRPFAARFDEEGGLPRSVIARMGAAGFLGAPFPATYGGLGLNPLQYGLFTAEIGKACPATRSLLTVHTSLVGETLLRLGTEQQKDQWLPALATGEKIAAFALTEPKSGSDAKNMQTTYRKEGDGYVLSGRKKWITFGNLADVFMVAAVGAKGVSVFLVERAGGGVTTTPITGLMAGRGTHLAVVDLDEAKVPARNLIAREGTGFAYVINTALDFGRYSVAWGGLAIVEEAVEAITGYIRTRSQFGNKLYNYQLVQGMLADLITDLSAARALCVQAGEMRGARHEDAVMHTNIAKYFSSKAAVKASGEAVQIHGANGFVSSYPAERLFREAKVLEVIEGSSQIQQQLIATYGLQKYFKPYHTYQEE